MARDIEATPTIYKGVRFRSRLEARWAVFWDELGVKWEYEPQTFKFPDGKQYTPDFWIVDLALWVEIKPNAKIAHEEKAEWKCSQLAYETGNLVYLDHGGFAWPISDDAKDILVLGYGWTYSVLFLACTGSLGQEDSIIYDSENHYWATCPECGKIGIATTIMSSSLTLFRNDIFSCECYTRHHWLDRYSEILMEAYDKALRYWS